MPPRAMCGAAAGRGLVEYSRRPRRPNGKQPYLCEKCFLAFMRSTSEVFCCSRGHGPMYLDTSGEEFCCLFCGERGYPSTKGAWVGPNPVKKRKRGRPPWKQTKEIHSQLPEQRALF